MPKYKVIWSKRYTNNLADIWRKSSNRNRVTKADDQINRILGSGDPSGLADHLSEGLYRLEIPPLRVYFEIDHEKLVVRILKLGKYLAH